MIDNYPSPLSAGFRLLSWATINPKESIATFRIAGREAGDALLSPFRCMNELTNTKMFRLDPIR